MYRPISDVLGTIYVMSRRETEWVEAGLSDIKHVENQINSFDWFEFSPAKMLAKLPSAARLRASRENGAKGGRPRKKGADI